MAKAFSDKFYHSKRWKRCRTNYIENRRMVDGGMCERCHEKVGEELHHKIVLTPENINNAEISLGEDNLVWLCKDCHFEVHRELIMNGFRRKTYRKILQNGCYFDEEGQLVPMRVIVVWGAPGSGKNTYVNDRRNPTDLIVDLDAIQQALGYRRYSPDGNLVELSIRIRNLLYEAIESRDPAVDCKNVWVIAGLPRKKERDELIRRLKAESVFVDSSIEKCREHIVNDEAREDKQLAIAISEKWFEDYEP